MPLVLISQINEIASMMGIFDQEPSPSAAKRNESRLFVSSPITPMGGRIHFERLTCNTTNAGPRSPFRNSKTTTTKTMVGVYVRIRMNEAYYPLPDCKDGPGESCLLTTWKAKMEKKTSDAGDFATRCGLKDQPLGEGIATFYWDFTLPWETIISP
jgi:acid phosphatase